MPVPASKGALSEIFVRFNVSALDMKGQAQNLRNRLAAGNVSVADIIETERLLRQYRGNFVATAATEGIVEYARSQWMLPELDVGAEFNSMIAAIDAVTVWIRANIPSSGGFLLLQTWPAGAEPVYRTFTPAQTAPLRTVLDTLIATVV